MAPAPPFIQELRILNFVLPPFACVVTYFRLWVRYKRSKLWWDDFWAFMCTLCIITFMAAVELHLDNTSLPQHVKVSIYYMCAQFFYAVGWTAKISILFTLIRLSFGQIRRFLSFVAVLLFLAWTILFCQVWWVCERQPGWKELVTPQCALGKDVGIAQVITDVISDAILVAAPMRLLWHVHLNRSLKFRLLAVFATTSVATAVSLYHAYELLRFGGVEEFFAAVIQVAVSLLVANLSVVVAFAFRLKTDSESDNREPLSTTPVITFGHGNSRRRNHGVLSTLGWATQTEIEPTSEMQVHIDIARTTDSGWRSDGSTVYQRDDTHTMELNDFQVKGHAKDQAFETKKDVDDMT